MMTDSFNSGVTYQVNPAGSDITDFNLTTDRLDFGEISVHGLILGSLPDGTAAIVNPWADQVQALQGLRWSDLSLNNLGVVGNEHLRQDIGAVFSWEQGIGLRQSDTIYIRSHQFGVQEVINDFDPQTQKLSFLYTGTRERLSVVDTDQGLLIQFEPTNQSVLLKGVQRSELIGSNLEFHHDQVMEDNLEVPFGFTEDEVSLVSRAGLLTPQAPSGASTDGEQVRAGLMVNSDPTVMAMYASQSMTDHSMHNHSMTSSSGELQASVAGQLYSGGMSGTLTLTNPSNDGLQDWSFSFLTDQPGFESWTAESSVTDLGGGRYQSDGRRSFISLKPKLRTLVEFVAYCVDFEKDNPTKADTFVIDTKPSNLDAVLRAINVHSRLHPDEDITSAAQAAIWLAQGVSIEDIRTKFEVSRSDEMLARTFIK